MKTRKLTAALTAVLCLLCTAAQPLSVSAETENRDQVHDSALVLDQNVAETLQALNRWLREHQINAYTALQADEHTIAVIGDSFDELEPVKAFVKAAGLDESLIEYGVESFAERELTGITAAPVTNDELEKLLDVRNQLWAYIDKAGYAETAAYAALLWNHHTVICYVQSEAVRAGVMQYMQSQEIAETLVDIVISPEYDFRMKDGGANSPDEVNLTAAAGYFGLKAYLADKQILSNIYLTEKPHADHPEMTYTGIDICVRTQADADALQAYMAENFYWDAIVTVTVQPDLSKNPAYLMHNIAYICTAGDANDDGRLGIADAVKLQKVLLTADTLYARTGAAADINQDGCVDVRDLTLIQQRAAAQK